MNRCQKHVEICLKAIIEIIRTIYAEVKILESISLPEHVDVLYEPLEDISTCIYFQKTAEEFTSDDIKVKTKLHFEKISNLKSIYNFAFVFRLFTTFSCIFNHNISCDCV